MANNKIEVTGDFLKTTDERGCSIILSILAISSVLDNKNGTCIIVMDNDYKIPINHSIEEIWNILEKSSITDE